MRIFRALLALAVLLLLLAGGIWEIASFISQGEARAPFRRWSGLAFAHSEAPLGYAIAIGLWGAAVGGFAWLALRQIRALRQSGRPESIAMFEAQERELEELNPSGYRPLWIALALACLIGAYALAAG
jgi:hypothetical protein